MRYTAEIIYKPNHNVIPMYYTTNEEFISFLLMCTDWGGSCTLIQLPCSLFLYSAPNPLPFFLS